MNKNIHAKTFIILATAFFGLAAALYGIDLFFMDTVLVSLKPSAGISRADLYYQKFKTTPDAVLVLCPGINGYGDSWLKSPVWREYAGKYNLGLVALSFASSGEDAAAEISYVYADKGSADLLFEGLKKIYGRDLPILIYGFSGGAQFAARLADYAPRRVVAWAAHSVRNTENLSLTGTMPPGIIADGTLDGNYAECRALFQRGRQNACRLLWIPVPELAHTRNEQLEQFVRTYFSMIVSSQSTHCWINTTNGEISTDDLQNNQLYGWLPNAELQSAWQALTNTPATGNAGNIHNPAGSTK